MKHAYLIMAHNEKELLKLLLKNLDSKQNDLFIHLDKKMDIDCEELTSVVRYSKTCFIERTDVRWGKYSQIKCELSLLKEATKTKYDYYHLLTGSCLPVKSKEYINSFFEDHKGEEFLSFDEKQCENLRFLKGVKEYYFIRPCVSKNKIVKQYFYFLNLFLRCLGKAVTLLLPNRLKAYPDIRWMKGSAYFDITDECARYIVAQEQKIKKMYRFSSCADEVFLHTLVYNSEFRNHICDIDTRYIDWSKGRVSPEILTLDHLEFMKAENFLFARKFSLEKSPEVVYEVCNNLIDCNAI